MLVLEQKDGGDLRHQAPVEAQRLDPDHWTEELFPVDLGEVVSQGTRVSTLGQLGRGREEPGGGGGGGAHRPHPRHPGRPVRGRRLLENTTKCSI